MLQWGREGTLSLGPKPPLSAETLERPLPARRAIWDPISWEAHCNANFPSLPLGSLGSLGALCETLPSGFR
jgi:hypothetical protein